MDEEEIDSRVEALYHKFVERVRVMLVHEYKDLNMPIPYPEHISGDEALGYLAQSFVLSEQEETITDIET